MGQRWSRAKAAVSGGFAPATEKSARRQLLPRIDVSGSDLPGQGLGIDVGAGLHPRFFGMLATWNKAVEPTTSPGVPFSMRLFATSTDNGFAPRVDTVAVLVEIHEQHNGPPETAAEMPRMMVPRRVVKSLLDMMFSHNSFLRPALARQYGGRS